MKHKTKAEELLYKEFPELRVVDTKHMVNQFLGWSLPKDFAPDGGIMFMDVFDNGTPEGGKHEPIGTNLFTAEQAEEMFDHCAIGHPPQLHHWLQLLVNNGCYSGTLQTNGTYRMSPLDPSKPTFRFNLKTGQPNSEEDYKKLIELVS